MSDVLNIWWITLQWIGLIGWTIVTAIGVFMIAIPIFILFHEGVLDEFAGPALCIFVGIFITLLVGVPYYVFIIQRHWLPS